MRKHLPLIFLAVVLVIARILSAHNITELANLQPLGALFFVCAAHHQKRWLWVPALAWFGTYAYTSSVQGYAWSWLIVISVLGLLALVVVGHFFRGKSPFTILGGSLLAATTFYFLTNSLSWLMDPGYAKTFSGYVQAMWTGLPGFSPTWLFFRNSLVSMGLFTSLFLAANHYFVPRPAKNPALVSAI